MLLRKRTGSDQNMAGQLTSDVDSQSYFRKASELKKSSFFPLSGLFVGLRNKCLEPDSVRSPTSPLDFKMFSNVSNYFVRSPSNHRKGLDGSKVGLRIVESLDHEAKEPKKVLRASDSRSRLFRPYMWITSPNSPHNMGSYEGTKSLPEGVGIFPFKKGSDLMFHVGEASFEPKSYGISHPSSLDSARHVSHLSRFANHTPNPASGNFGLKNGKDHSGSGQFLAPSSSADGIIGTIPPEIELSEDYTCVTLHGPNPKVTHIFCDRVLECHSYELPKFDQNNKDDHALVQTVEGCKVPTLYPSSDFLSFCHFCKKTLDGEDIYMYRGEKAFCSSNCRLQEILIDEEMEKSDNVVSESSTKLPNNTEERPESGFFISF